MFIMFNSISWSGAGTLSIISLYPMPPILLLFYAFNPSYDRLTNVFLIKPLFSNLFLIYLNEFLSVGAQPMKFILALREVPCFPCTLSSMCHVHQLHTSPSPHSKAKPSDLWTQLQCPPQVITYRSPDRFITDIEHPLFGNQAELFLNVWWIIKNLDIGNKNTGNTPYKYNTENTASL